MKFTLSSGEITVQKFPSGSVSLARNVDLSDNPRLSNTVDGFESLLMAIASEHDLNSTPMALAINSAWEAIINNAD